MWTQLPPEKGNTHPHSNFGPCLLWPNGWMGEDAACYWSKPRPRPHCTRQGPSSRERGIAAPCFRPMSIVATVAHLSYYWALVCEYKSPPQILATFFMKRQMIKNIDYLHAFAEGRHALSEDNILYRVACLLTTVGHYTAKHYCRPTVVIWLLRVP